MKNKALSLLMIPMILLVACKGPKISAEKASELAKKITENTEALEDASFEMNLTMKAASGKGAEKQETNLSYVLQQDKEENMKFKVKGKDKDKSYDYVIYVVKDKDYDTVAYIKEYNLETKEYNEYVYTKVTHDDYSSRTSPYTTNALVPAFLIAGLADPVKIMESEDFQEGESTEDELTYKTEVNYYSTGEKNMTIEAERKLVKGDIPEGDEEATEAKYTITYDNLIFKKAVITGKSNFGNNTSMNASLDLKKVNIELPKNWKDLLNREQLFT